MNPRRSKYLIAVIPALLFSFIRGGFELNTIIKEKKAKAAQAEVSQKRSEINTLIDSHNKSTAEKVAQQKAQLEAIQTPNKDQYTKEESLEFSATKLVIQYNLDNNITANTDQSITKLIAIRDRIESRFA